jgi:hypothetical protein
MSPFASWTLAQEARALQTRLFRVRPFALLEPMVPAAALLPTAQSAIEQYLVVGRRELRNRIRRFQEWLRGPGSKLATDMEGQRRFTFLRMRFNAVLTQFDLFNDVITQRSEHDTGVWLSGLDVVSADALTLRGDYYRVPPVICYLDRGVGAAIRRARTRLPGGGSNPVAVIRVPRERMVGSGIASSLIHEVGHQAAALLDLVESLRPVLQGMQRGRKDDARVWQYFERCISEIVADFFSVARVGVASTMGLIGVVSLPRPFVFRVNFDDPHPAPWIRVKLSCAMGKALYPHEQWDRLASLWESFYPLEGLDAERRAFLTQILERMTGFVALLVNHRTCRTARTFLGRSARRFRAAASETVHPIPGVVPDSDTDVRGARFARVCCDWAGTGRRTPYAGGRKRTAREATDSLGSAEHARCLVRVRDCGRRQSARESHLAAA